MCGGGRLSLADDGVARTTHRFDCEYMLNKKMYVEREEPPTYYLPAATAHTHIIMRELFGSKFENKFKKLKN